jgi:hypothetical protein
LIGNGTDRNTLFVGYPVGAGAMIIGGAAVFRDDGGGCDGGRGLPAEGWRWFLAAIA